MEESDFVYTKDENGKIHSNGYTIENMFLENNMPLVKKGKKNKQQGGGIFNVSTLAVPFGLYVMQRASIPESKYVKEEQKVEFMDESLYDKLVNLVSPNKNKNTSKKPKTKKVRFSKKLNKTRRYRK
jgi:hypothetical protein